MTGTARRPVTLITGASSGIGRTLAHVFAAHGHELALVARRESELIALADELTAKGHPRAAVIVADLALPDTAGRLEEALAARNLEPETVVNNAGFGLLGSAANLDRAEQLAMIDVNVRVLTDLSLAWTNTLKRHRGGILNVASVAGFLPGPGMAVYYATKAYVVSFSEALHQELAPKGVRVTALCPGPVRTGFQERAGIPDRQLNPLLTLSAEAVAEQGYRGFRAGRRVVVPGLANQAVTYLARIAPRGLILAATAAHNRRRR